MCEETPSYEGLTEEEIEIEQAKAESLKEAQQQTNGEKPQQQQSNPQQPQMPNFNDILNNAFSMVNGLFQSMQPPKQPNQQQNTTQKQTEQNTQAKPQQPNQQPNPQDFMKNMFSMFGNMMNQQGQQKSQPNQQDFMKNLFSMANEMMNQFAQQPAPQQQPQPQQPPYYGYPPYAYQPPYAYPCGYCCPPPFYPPPYQMPMGPYGMPGFGPMPAPQPPRFHMSLNPLNAISMMLIPMILGLGKSFGNIDPAKMEEGMKKMFKDIEEKCKVFENGEKKDCGEQCPISEIMKNIFDAFIAPLKDNFEKQPEKNDGTAPVASVSTKDERLENGDMKHTETRKIGDRVLEITTLTHSDGTKDVNKDKKNIKDEEIDQFNEEWDSIMKLN